MDFLDHFSPEQRDRLVRLATPVRVARGERMMRQGERGGDVYYVEEGVLEVLSRGSNPEIVLSTIQPGEVVGEMAFVEPAPRAADVRAATDVRLRRWLREALLRAFDEQPDLGMAFYRALARTTVRRIRSLQRSAVSGGLALPEPDELAADRDIARRADELATPVQRAWAEAEQRLRLEPAAAEVEGAVRAALLAMVEAVDDWIAGLRGEAERRAAGEALAFEMRPYLARAGLVQLLQDAPERAAGDPRVLAHVLLGRGSGDGRLGVILDEALLDLPTCRAMRQRLDRATACLAELLGAGEGEAAITLAPAAPGAALARLVPEVAGRGAAFTLVDADREALEFVDVGHGLRPRSVRLRLVLGDLARPARALADVPEGSQDALFLDGIADHLPEKLLLDLLAAAALRLRPGGVLVVTALAPSGDAAFLDRLLGWPTVRRDGDALHDALVAAGFEPRAVERCGGGTGVVGIARSTGATGLARA